MYFYIVLSCINFFQMQTTEANYFRCSSFLLAPTVLSGVLSKVVEISVQLIKN